MRLAEKKRGQDIAALLLLGHAAGAGTPVPAAEGGHVAVKEGLW